MVCQEHNNVFDVLFSSGHIPEVEHKRLVLSAAALEDIYFIITYFSFQQPDEHVHLGFAWDK